MADPMSHWIAELFRRHHPELLSRAARLVGDRDTGEDVLQTTYVNLTAARPEAVGIGNPRHYALTALRHAAFDHTRKRRREWLYRIDVDGIEDLAGGGDPADAMLFRERVAQLAMLLNELPRACSAVFLMNRIEGLTHREIAARMGISVSMVEKHMMRALRLCREARRLELADEVAREGTGEVTGRPDGAEGGR